jgi:hypothetical protein
MVKSVTLTQMANCSHAILPAGPSNLKIRVAILCLVFCGCSSFAPVPPLDLAAPGWQVRQGQAIWKPADDKPEITGDLLLSLHPSDGAFIQFTKTLPIVSARLSAKSWEIEFPPENKRYSGRGQPPKRIGWLQLIRAIEGHEVPGRWTLIRPSNQFVGLLNAETGERLEVHFQE